MMIPPAVERQDEFMRLTTVRTVIRQEIINYIKNIVFVNEETPDKINEFFKSLKDEYVRHCVNRKFNALNINVLRANNERVIQSTSLRSFYFELYTSVCVSMKMDHGEEASVSFNELFASLSVPPCTFMRKHDDSLNIGAHGEDFVSLCKSVEVQSQGVKMFLDNNPWYYCFILVGYCAHLLIEDLNSLSNVGKT